MAKSKLNEIQKDRVAELVQTGIEQKKVASFFNVSPRTVTRILHERGMIHNRLTLSDKENDFLALMRETGLSVPEVRAHLSSPLMTAESLYDYAAKMDDAALTHFIMNVCRARDLFQAEQKQAALRCAQAANGEMKQERLYE